MQTAGALDGERVTAILRRAEQQPVGAAAVLAEARRLRAALRGLAERGGAAVGDRTRDEAVAEINRVLGRSTGTLDRVLAGIIPVALIGILADLILASLQRVLSRGRVAVAAT